MNEISENNPHEIFIKTLKISNYKGFKACEKEDLSDAFSVEFCTPNGIMGSGLTILLGDNNCGKTTVLDAVNLAKEYTPIAYDRLRANESVYNNKNKDVAIRFRLTSGAVQERRMAAYDVHGKNSNDRYYEGSLSQRPPQPSFHDNEGQQEYRKAFGCFNDRICMIRKEHREKMMVRACLKGEEASLHIPIHTFSDFLDMQDFLQSRSSIIEESDKKINKNTHLLKNTQTDPVFTRTFHMSDPDPLYASYPNSYSYNYSPENPLKTKLEREYDTLGNGALVFSSIEERIKMCEKQQPEDKTSYYEKNIFLIDEPEEALHPRAITELVKFLCDTAKTCQIILTTHSLQIVEDVLSLLRENNQKEPEKHFRILTKENGKISLTDMSECSLRYISASEINYVAFGRVTAGYYVELFEEIKGKYIKTDKETDAFFEKVTEAADIDGKGMNYRDNRNHIVHDERHQIAENKKMKFAIFLEKGISDLRGVLKYIKTHPEQYPEIKK